MATDININLAAGRSAKGVSVYSDSDCSDITALDLTFELVPASASSWCTVQAPTWEYFRVSAIANTTSSVRTCKLLIGLKGKKCTNFNVNIVQNAPS